MLTRTSPHGMQARRHQHQVAMVSQVALPTPGHLAPARPTTAAALAHQTLTQHPRLVQLGRPLLADLHGRTQAMLVLHQEASMRRLQGYTLHLPPVLDWTMPRLAFQPQLPAPWMLQLQAQDMGRLLEHGQQARQRLWGMMIRTMSRHKMPLRQLEGGGVSVVSTLNAALQQHKNKSCKLQAHELVV